MSINPIVMKEDDMTMDAALRSIQNNNISCVFCKHRFNDSIACDAFPDAIPPVFYSGERQHTKPYPGDNGIQFEPKE